MNYKKKIALAIVVFLLFAIIAAVISLKNEQKEQKQNIINDDPIDSNITVVPSPVITEPIKVLKSDTPSIIREYEGCSMPPQLGVFVKNPANQAVEIKINVGGNIKEFSLNPTEGKHVQVPINTNIQEGEIKLSPKIYVDGVLIYDEAIKVYCGSSGGKNTLDALPVQPAMPTSTETVDPTQTQTPTPTETQNIPEFPTIALPMMAIIGIIFLFGRKKK